MCSSDLTGSSAGKGETAGAAGEDGAFLAALPTATGDGAAVPAKAPVPPRGEADRTRKAPASTGQDRDQANPAVPPNATPIPAATPTPVEMPSVPEPPRTAGSGTLVLNARPWADVFVDGRSAGRTPVLGLAVPAGTHRIEFRHPALPSQVETRDVAAGGKVVVNAEMGAPGGGGPVRPSPSASP